MYCPFKKEVVQEQSMPTQLATPEPPKVVITETFEECEPKTCMASYRLEDGSWRCNLCDKGM